VQPITTEPSIGLEGGVGVVVHLSKIRKKQINISSIEQRRNQNSRDHNDNTSTQILIQTDDDLAKLSFVKTVQNLENYLIPK
jgi:hypothetical protein